MPYISKTDYVLWRACPKNAWLRIHKPELYGSNELTEYEQSVIDMGIEVECIARNLFPQGVLVAGTKTEAQQNTLKYLASNTETLFQAVFQREQLLAAIDVLQHDNETDGYSIHEIKSSTEVREEHLYDLAFQVILLRQHGMHIRRASIVYLNAGYVRDGELDVQQLFSTVDVTKRIDQISGTVIEEMQQARTYLLNEVEPAGRCSCIYKARSKHCTTFEYSNPDVPRYGVHDIARIGSSPKKLKELVDAGILALEDMPSDIKFTSTQSSQLRAHRTGKTVIEKEAIAKELGDLTFPLHFIDYETFAPALPLFTNYSPYDHHKDLCGKASIKNVLPVLTPHLSYSSLGIHDGATASLVWSKLIPGQLNDEENARLYDQLREYCALDSYGMYAIWRALLSLIEA